MIASHTIVGTLERAGRTFDRSARILTQPEDTTGRVEPAQEGDAARAVTDLLVARFQFRAGVGLLTVERDLTHHLLDVIA